MKHKHHIIPKHIGGDDNPTNLIELSIEEHAAAHRILFDEHGRWQDYVAWQGLAKLATKEEHVAMLLSAAGKKGAAISNSRYTPERRKKLSNSIKIIRENIDQLGEKNPNAKEYFVTYPDGTKEKVKALRFWCEVKGLNYNSFYNQCVGRGRKHKGYTVTKV